MGIPYSIRKSPKPTPRLEAVLWTRRVSAAPLPALAWRLRKLVEAPWRWSSLGRRAHGAPAAAAVALVGDSQAEGAELLRQLAALPRRTGPGRPGCALLAHLGDLVLHATKPHEWDDGALGPLTSVAGSALGQSLPLLALRGNHDVDEDNGAAFNANLGQGAARRRYFAFTALGIRFLVLDSSYEDPGQTAWLRSELRRLRRARARLRKSLRSVQGRRACSASRVPAFTVALLHVGPYVEYWDPAVWRSPALNESAWADFVRRDFAPLFEEFGVDVVASGHSHVYLRGWRNGVLYLNTGGGGAGLERGEGDRVESFLEPRGRVMHFAHHVATLRPSAAMARGTAARVACRQRPQSLQLEALSVGDGDPPVVRRIDRLVLPAKL